MNQAANNRAPDSESGALTISVRASWGKPPYRPAVSLLTASQEWRSDAAWASGSRPSDS